ncbi:MAG: MFS transporter [Geminicoccaceae bacterium]|nr:MFS transporter [Geminicoccaceae bacterium]MCB9944106.1 MFS transporter [Geminicoccaceae bacterium]
MMAASAGTAKSQVEVIGLVTTAHFFSHLYILALPPLFPVLTADAGYSATQLGVAIAVFNLLTALLQAPMGFAVDRFGSAVILAAGQALSGIAFILIGIIPGYAALLAAMVIAGIGNAVYHPADYAILAGRIDNRRAGRAFSIHTFGGYLGFAIAPPVMVGLHGMVGWQTAVLTIGIIGLLFAFVLIARQGMLEPPHQDPREPRASASDGDRWRLLFSPPILMAFLFFVAIAMSHTGFTNFGVLALERLQGLDLAHAAIPVTIYLAASAVGVLMGGWVADRISDHDRFVMVTALVAAILTLPLAFFALPFAISAILFLFIGIASGIIAPSRDMIVRKLAPEGRAGVVFGFVTTGFNAGGLIAPPLLGLAIDMDRPELVFLTSAVFFAAIIATLGLRRTAA